MNRVRYMHIKPRHILLFLITGICARNRSWVTDGTQNLNKLAAAIKQGRSIWEYIR